MQKLDEFHSTADGWSTKVHAHPTASLALVYHGIAPIRSIAIVSLYDADAVRATAQQTVSCKQLSPSLVDMHVEVDEVDPLAPLLQLSTNVIRNRSSVAQS